MPRSMWKGSVSFGLVNIPVQMYTAVRDHTIRFHRMSDDGSCRLRTKLYCPETGKEFDFDKTARGFEVAPDQYVILDDEEIDSIKPDHGHTIDIEDFVSLDEIDPVFYDRPYYLAPASGGSRPYRLLVEAMERSGKVGIARFTLREKSHLSALRVSQGGLCLSTMRYHDEVLALSDVTKIPDDTVDERQIELATQLIGALTRPFEPDRYEDAFRQQVQELIERKAQGERIPVVSEEEEPEAEVVDLMDALKRSLGADRKEDDDQRAPKRKKAPAKARKSA